jgi:asparagine synthase (glutamine-hydrolysing)
MPTRLAAPVRAWAIARLRDRPWPTPLRRGLRALSILGESPRAAQRWLARNEPWDTIELQRDSADLTARIEALAGALSSLGPGRQAMAADRLERLPGAMLTKVDIASMSASLEVRVPLLDDALVRFADGLDEAQLIGVRRGKLLLRRVLAGILPGRLASAHKRGFTIPIEDWMRVPRTRRELAGLFADEHTRLQRLTGLDARQRLRTFLDVGAHQPSAVSGEELFWLGSVALWARRFGITEAVLPDPDAAPLA